jgi:hypothetical protein
MPGLVDAYLGQEPFFQDLRNRGVEVHPLVSRGGPKFSQLIFGEDKLSLKKNFFHFACKLFFAPKKFGEEKLSLNNFFWMLSWQTIFCTKTFLSNFVMSTKQKSGLVDAWLGQQLFFRIRENEGSRHTPWYLGVAPNFPNLFLERRSCLCKNFFFILAANYFFVGGEVLETKKLGGMVSTCDE